jgi:phenylacetate-CoA ligase
MASCGLAAGDLVDQTTMYSWVIAATAFDRALQMIGCAVVPGGVGQSERHLEVIRALGIEAIVAFPTFLEHLLESARAEGRPLGLKKAVVMGELSHPDTKARLRQAHGIEAREFYGVADVGAVAWECAEGAGMHLRDDLLVEFMAPGGDTAVEPAPDSPAELVVTDFHRRAMPIVRLRTGDIVDGLIRERCACGSHAPRLRRIAGRAGEITKVKGMFVVPRLVRDTFLRQGLDRAYRLVVARDTGGRDRLRLEVEGPGVADAAGLQAAVESALRMKLEMRFVEALPAGGPRLVDLRGDGRPA